MSKMKNFFKKWLFGTDDKMTTIPAGINTRLKQINICAIVVLIGGIFIIAAAGAFSAFKILYMIFPLVLAGGIFLYGMHLKNNLREEDIETIEGEIVNVTYTLTSGISQKMTKRGKPKNFTVKSGDTYYLIPMRVRIMEGMSVKIYRNKKALTYIDNEGYTRIFGILGFEILR